MERPAERRSYQLIVNRYSSIFGSDEFKDGNHISSERGAKSDELIGDGRLEIEDGN
jgi:hypothetical protein